MHDHLSECAREEQVEGREGKSGGGYEKQKIDRVPVKGDSRPSVFTTNAPSKAIVADPR
jgi:hypothetical protein